MILEKLTDTTCRFPFGEKDKISFCGHKIWKEHSYCKEHYKLTHVERDTDIGCTLGGKPICKKQLS